MPESQQIAPQTPPPHVQLIQMARAHVVSRMVHAAAKLGLADQLATGPKSAAQLAGPLGVHAPSLHRLMRALASLGVLSEQSEQRFALTDLGEALRTDARSSAKAAVLYFGGASSQSGWDQLLYAVQTGQTGFAKAHGMPFFAYLAQHPEEASLFSEVMVGFNGPEVAAVAAAYDFSPFATIVDVGGATGNLLAAILGRHVGPRGVLFDRAHVVVDAPALLRTRGVAERVTVETGDFFETVPAAGDAYILSHVLHDWNDQQCLTILGRVRHAIGQRGRLLIVEMVLPSGDAPHPGKMLDMSMLVITGGQERSEAEYALLLGEAGFRLIRVVPTDTAVSVIEATPAAAA
jgi:hypothetical protein